MSLLIFLQGKSKCRQLQLGGSTAAGQCCGGSVPAAAGSWFQPGGTAGAAGPDPGANAAPRGDASVLPGHSGVGPQGKAGVGRGQATEAQPGPE